MKQNEMHERLFSNSADGSLSDMVSFMMETLLRRPITQLALL